MVLNITMHDENHRMQRGRVLEIFKRDLCFTHFYERALEQNPDGKDFYTRYYEAYRNTYHALYINDTTVPNRADEQIQAENEELINQVQRMYELRDQPGGLDQQGMGHAVFCEELYKRCEDEQRMHDLVTSLGSLIQLETIEKLKGDAECDIDYFKQLCAEAYLRRSDSRQPSDDQDNVDEGREQDSARKFPRSR